ncbi:MAG: hypothetical protein E7446_01390 [Ruminococcaceae bacterium]|nr:hypothetical protein [Oscillospiraceae bacterium]
MKKTFTILCIFLLMLSLVGCEPIRDLENYYVDQYEGGYSVLYKDDKGTVEQIVALGSEPQPLVIAKGRICFVEEGKVVSVDLEGENRQELPVEDLPASAHITYMDDTYLYCLTGPSARTCWEVYQDLHGYSQGPVPRKYRSVDYAKLLQAIRTQVAASEDRIRVRSARVELDGFGTPLSMTLEVIAHSGKISGMEFWNRGTVTVVLPIGSIETGYRDHHMPLSLADWTVEETVTLEQFLTALETMDKAEVPAQRALGTGDGYVLAYLQEEYDALRADYTAWVTISGAESSAEVQEPFFVLGQWGGCSPMLTDSEGLEVGNLYALHWEN